MSDAKNVSVAVVSSRRRPRRTSRRLAWCGLWFMSSILAAVVSGQAWAAEFPPTQKVHAGLTAWNRGGKAGTVTFEDVQVRSAR